LFKILFVIDIKYVTDAPICVIYLITIIDDTFLLPNYCHLFQIVIDGFINEWAAICFARLIDGSTDAF
jgi:hypothetical protein